MEPTSQTEKTAPYVMTPDSVAAYIQHEIDRGVSAGFLRNAKRVTSALYEWLPENKVITKDLLLAWRQSLKDHGYTSETELHYVKTVNRYLDYMGFSDVRFNRGRAKDIAGKQFGYLTAIEPTGEKYRKDYIWRCRCKCGNEVELPATRLLTGNTLSCGCLRKERFMEAHKFIAGTSLRMSLEEQVHSTRSVSGYTGVLPYRGKWQAQIMYKGQRIFLGCYSKLEDAVKARARGKELVQMDAMGLLDIYEELHKNDPAFPEPSKVRAENKQPKSAQPAPSILPAIRSNNTSGHPGVLRKRNKWEAKITYQKRTYRLGVYEDMEDALAARLEAEEQLKKDPEQFALWMSHRKEGNSSKIEDSEE